MNSIARLCEQYSSIKNQINVTFSERNLTESEYTELIASANNLEGQIKESMKASLTYEHHAHLLADLIWHGMPVHDPEKEEKLLRCLINVLNA